MWEQTLFLFLSLSLFPEYEIVPESHWKSIHARVKILSALYVAQSFDSLQIKIRALDRLVSFHTLA